MKEPLWVGTWKAGAMFALIWAGCGACSVAAGEPAADVRFTAKPAATRAGDKVKIEFAVSRETDVAVFIEDAKGNIVRHLVAGVLGKNPPPPLKTGSLAQTIEWDGKADYGKPAVGGPFKVRVALGMGAKYDKVLISEPGNIGAIHNLAVGPDGTLYVVNSWCNMGPGVISQSMEAYNRDGTYQRTILPFPSGLKTEQVKGAGVVEIDGRPVPLVKGFRNFYAPQGFPKAGMAVTQKGQILFPLGGIRLAAVASDGGLPWGDFAGPFLFGQSLHTNYLQRLFVAVSGDDNWAYMSGLGHCSTLESAAKLDNPYPAVFKVKLPERSSAEILFGDKKATGNDTTHLGGLPSGIAVDGKGNVLVGDPANKRVVVISEKDGKFAGSFPVEGADCLAVDPATGAVYVTRLTGAAVELVKFSSWKDGKAIARMPLPTGIQPEYPWVMAADFSAKPPVVWIGGNFGDSGNLQRIEDLGDKFSAPRQIITGKFGPYTYVNLSVDRISKTVYAGKNPLARIQDGEDKISVVSADTPHAICQIVPTPDGGFYSQGYPQPGVLRKLDANGKATPWAAEGKPDVSVFTSQTILTHTLGVRPSDGHAFVFEEAPPYPPSYGGKACKRLVEFGLDGKRVAGDPLIWSVSDAVLGPKFDAQGNIYIADQVRLAGQLCPAEFAGVAKTAVGKVADGMYGSIIKFSPASSIKGGMVTWLEKNPHFSDVSLLKPARQDPSLKIVDAVSLDSNAWEATPVHAQVIGAEWVHLGISHVAMVYCSCETTRFDADEFGRVFYPDLCRFRVGVLDTNGNEMTYFGGYGNADSMGPDSPVVDPKTKQVRPRRTDDPKDLKSPFAEPDIAFAWLSGVCVTDKNVYMSDIINRRIMRAKLIYAAEETCPLP